MIQVKEFPNKTFASKEDLYAALIKHEKDLTAQKKMTLKKADAVAFDFVPVDSKGEVVKADTVDFTTVTKIKAKLIINSTNLFDSHSDVHIKGLWTKTLKETKDLYLLKQHRMTFEDIITDEVKAKAENTTFKDIGVDLEGNTQVLVFNVIIDKYRNPYMFEQYAKGYVKNHSVGMRYVKIALAINTEAEFDKKYKDVWDKYYPEIANKADVDDKGFFWAVTEAKLIEGSAVVKGSNWATPTQSIEESKADTITLETKDSEPSDDTRTSEFINLNLY